jgi:hypothetical protein
VDGGHRGVEEGCQEGAVDVVDYLEIPLALRHSAQDRETYEESSHSFVLPRERREACFRRQGVHDVKEREETRRLHREPCYLARDVESTIARGLSGSIPGNEPL